MIFLFKNKIYKFVLITLLFPSLLSSTEFLSDRMKATLDENGKLKIESNYLTNYILRGYDAETKENKYLNIVSASDKKINFDLVDIEWDGLFPKDINFKPPRDNWQPTDNDLVTDYSSTKWKNMQLNITGSGLLDIKIALQDPSVDGADLISTFLLNLVGLANVSMEAVGNSSKLTSQFNKTKFDRLRKLSETITGWKSQVKSFGTYVSISRISLEYVDALLTELEIDKNVDHYLSDYYRVSSSLLTSIKELEKLSGVIASVNSEEENRLKGNLAERFKKIDLYKGIEATPNALAKEIAKNYNSATSDSEKTRILMDGLKPLAELVNLYEKLLKDKLKVTGISETEKKELDKKILFLKGGRTIIIFASLIYGGDDLVELARKNPEKIMNSLIEIGKTAVGEILKLDNLDTIAKVAYKDYVGTFGIAKSDDYYNNINKIGKANLYMKAVALGATLGNKLIPMVWDIVMSPYSMSSLVKDGKLNKFGLLKSKVGIYKRINGNLEEIQTLTNTVGSKDTVIAVNEGETIEVFVDGKQERLFENSVAPWIVSPSYTPRSVYDVLISTPTTYTNDYVCVRKIIGNTDFSIYSEKKEGSYNLIAGQCGAGTLFGGDWYKNSINPDELNSKYKLYLFNNDITHDNLSNASYTYNPSDNKYITISITDINFQNTFYKIKLVPALKNVTFTSDTSALTSENLIVSFNNANIEASTQDPITSYTYDWGDGKNSTFTALGNTTHTYSTAGNYTVLLTVTTDSGMTYTFSEEISTVPKVEFPLTLDSKTSTHFNLSWTVPTGATKYKLCQSSIDEVSYNTAQTCNNLVDGYFFDSTTSLNMSINSDGAGNILQQDTTYYFRVVAYNDSDEVVGVSSLVSDKLAEVDNTETNLIKGLVAHYEFEGNANDSSKGNNGTTPNGDLTYVDGVIGKAGSFDGVDDYIEINNFDESLKLVNTSFSISAWTYVENKGNVDKPIFYLANHLNNNSCTNCIEDGYQFWYGWEDDSIYLSKPNKNKFNLSTSNYNNWKMITMTFNKVTNTVTLMENGKIIDYIKDNIAIKEFTTNNSAFIGFTKNYSGKYFNGKIDDLRIYNRALNEAEIKELYKLGTIQNNGNIISDDFSSSDINQNNWIVVRHNRNYTNMPTDYSSVSINDGKLYLLQDRTDDGPQIHSKPFLKRNTGKLIIERRAKISYANNNFRGRLYLMESKTSNLNGDWFNEDVDTFCAVTYDHDSYDAPDDNFVLGDQLFTPIWNEYFNEKLTYDFSSSIATYTLNGITKSYQCKAPKTDYIKVMFDSYGWFTGHETWIDNINVSIE